MKEWTLETTLINAVLFLKEKDWTFNKENKGWNKNTSQKEDSNINTGSCPRTLAVIAPQAQRSS